MDFSVRNGATCGVFGPVRLVRCREEEDWSAEGNNVVPAEVKLRR